MVKDLKDPTQVLCDNIPKLSKMLEEFGLDENNKNDVENADTLEAVKKLFKQAMGTFSKHQDQLNQNQTKLYGTIWGQCSPALQSEIIGDLDYKEKSEEYACLWLLSKLQKLCSGLDDNSNCYIATFSAI